MTARQPRAVFHGGNDFADGGATALHLAMDCIHRQRTDSVRGKLRCLAIRFTRIALCCSASAAMTVGCGAGGSSSSSADTPPSQPSPADPVPHIAALGSPRILLADATTASRLRDALTRGDAPAARLAALVDAQMQGGDAYAFQPWFAALIGQLTSKPAYCRYAVDETERFVQHEETLIASKQRPTVADDSYLEVGQVIGNLAIVYDWCRAQTTAKQRARWQRYANQAVWNVWNFNQARWGDQDFPWSGWSVDNPANNYYYSFLRATMLLGLASFGENEQAKAWIDKFRTEKIASQLVPVFNRDLVGGGSREGTGYGTAMKGLFDLYYWWEKSTGERIADLSPHTLASLDKFPHDVMPTLDRLAPTGDHARDSTAALFDYHREYLLILARLYPNDAMAGVVKTLLAQSSVPRMANGFEAWADFVYDVGDIAQQPLNRLPTAHWGPGTGQFSMRSKWAGDAAYANLICGPLTESHAHRDQGSFVFFKGAWLAYDANIDSHSGLMADEAAHNLVRIEQNGEVIQQADNSTCTLQALTDNADYSYGLAMVTQSYAGRLAVKRFEREFVFIKPGVLLILDRVQTSGNGLQHIWTLNLPAAPTLNGERLSMTNGGHQLDVVRLAPTGLPWHVAAWPSLSSDMNGGFRAQASDAGGDASIFVHVLGADRAFTQAQLINEGEQVGALLTLADGRSVTLRFSRNGTGGGLEIRSAAGQVSVSGALPNSIQTPARFAN